MVEPKRVFVDTETTGLDVRVHQAYEFAWLPDRPDYQVRTIKVAHNLDNAEPEALAIGKYFERGFHPRDDISISMQAITELQGATLVGANPAFDQEFMHRRIFGFKHWHYRMIDIESMAFGIMKLDAPMGLARLADTLSGRVITGPAWNYPIGVPDHTAAGDVLVTQQVFYALLDIQSTVNLGVHHE